MILQGDDIQEYSGAKLHIPWDDKVPTMTDSCVVRVQIVQHQELAHHHVICHQSSQMVIWILDCQGTGVLQVFAT